MPGFVYYLPNIARAPIDTLREMGLGYAFEDRVTPAGVTNGPDQQRGLVVADPRLVDENQIGYFPQRQIWQQIPATLPGGSAGGWIGMATGVRFRPEDLRREQQIEGHSVRLADGQRWLVPVARKALPIDDQITRYTIALPHVCGLNASGEWTSGHVLARYAPLWQTATQFWDSLVGARVEDGSLRMDFDNVLDAAVLALSCNYRLGKVEASLLGLLTYEHAVEVLEALVDWKTVMDWVKKKETSLTVGSNTAPGPAAAIPTTSPPAPTSGHSPSTSATRPQ